MIDEKRVPFGRRARGRVGHAARVGWLGRARGSSLASSVPTYRPYLTCEASLIRPPRAERALVKRSLFAPSPKGAHISTCDVPTPRANDEVAAAHGDSYFVPPTITDAGRLVAQVVLLAQLVGDRGGCGRGGLAGRARFAVRPPLSSVISRSAVTFTRSLPRRQSASAARRGIGKGLTTTSGNWERHGIGSGTRGCRVMTGEGAGPVDADGVHQHFGLSNELLQRRRHQSCCSCRFRRI